MKDDTNSKKRFGRLLLTSFLVVGMLLSGTTAASAYPIVNADSISVEPISVDGEDNRAEFLVVNNDNGDATVTYKVNGTTQGSVTTAAHSVERFTVPTGSDDTVEVGIYVDGELVGTASSDGLTADSDSGSDAPTVDANETPNVDTSEIQLSARGTDEHDDLARFKIQNDGEVPAAVTYKVLDTGEGETVTVDGDDAEYVTVSTGADDEVTLGLYHDGELIDVKTNAEQTIDLGPENPKDCNCAVE